MCMTSQLPVYTKETKENISQNLWEAAATRLEHPHYYHKNFDSVLT